jgi:peptidoglycan hydrolase-like protein with peptidoglycan-binding domain
VKKLITLALALALLLAIAAPAMAKSPQVGCSGTNCWPRYSYGDEDTDVTAIQDFLLYRHFANFKPNGGYYGAQTVQAVKRFQKASGLPVSGVMYAASWKKLVVPVRYNQRNQAVSALQTELSQQYGYKLPVTGYYGNQTRAAVASFKKTHGLTGTGSSVGAVAWQSIISTR